ncbi:hypothetical protein GCM10010371_52330 [Streptomyces subrutilus]|uniref:DUF1684 domain-containing protein n=1 Tax=Streptomyces subrutilus TaxID=36818 RepID=A0A5P2UUT4_9ACTN|nr:DUF1684 domain-containing protein [Streptomyces subrutilus]QEU81261.1 DUF1684 domain-containing protein [Streptomyces subrutilus]GGZ85903.1 hypothetical protein GCM10010371_52330 [Streptomyces subrutilus]
MSDDADEARAEWRAWHERRVAAVSAPYGPLALTGTHWLADYPEGRIPAVPGHWRPTGDGVELTAAPEDSLRLDGEPFTGGTVLSADGGPPERARLSADGGARLVVIRREGEWAVRVFDPGSEARRTFAGIEATAYDPAFAVPGRFRPYDRDRTVQVENADGRARGLGLGGELAFALGGAEHTLQVAVDEGDGGLWAVFGDATGGRSSYRFRFLRPGTPAADGTLTVDLNRALLPPCAFADHFICPFPPPGNTLPFEVAAGERRLKAALATGI